MHPLLRRRTSRRYTPLPELDVAISDAIIRFTALGDIHSNASPSQFQEEQLWAAVAYALANPREAVIAKGDVGNNTSASVRHCLSILRQMRRPLFVPVGNHDEIHLSSSRANPTNAESGLLLEGSYFDVPSLPMVEAEVITSGDGTKSVLIITLDCNYYYGSDGSGEDPQFGDGRILPDPYHVIGERIGYVPGTISGDYYRMLGSTQISWFEDALAANPGHDGLIVLAHYPFSAGYVYDKALIADAIQSSADYGPTNTIFLAGHVHANASVATFATTDAAEAYTVWRPPAVLESGCWGDVALDFSAGMTIGSWVLHNFHARSQTDGWSIDTSDGWSIDEASVVEEEGYELAESGGVYTVQATA